MAAYNIIDWTLWILWGSPTLVDDHLGRANSAYSFDWINDSITTWSNLGLTSFPFTITFSFKFNWARIEILEWSTVSSYYWVIITPIADWSMFVSYWNWWGSASSNRKSFQSATWIFTTWNWYNVQMVCTDINTVTMYVNWTQYSVPYVSGTASSINFTWATYSIWFAQLGSIYWNGTISQLIIQNGVWLSLVEWQAMDILQNSDYIYPINKGSTLWLQNGLVMHLDWSNNWTTTLYDISWNWVNATVSSTPTYTRVNQSKVVWLTAQSITWASTTFSTSTCWEKVSWKWKLQTNPAYITATWITSTTKEIQDIRLYDRVLATKETEQLDYLTSLRIF